MNLQNFFAELKRRNVYKVAIAYAVVAWLLMQIASQIFPFLRKPLFYPLNYGNDDLERINGLNRDGQIACATQRFLEGDLRARLSEAYSSILATGNSM